MLHLVQKLQNSYNFDFQLWLGKKFVLPLVSYQYFFANNAKFSTHFTRQCKIIVSNKCYQSNECNC